MPTAVRVMRQIGLRQTILSPVIQLWHYTGSTGEDVHPTWIGRHIMPPSSRCGKHIRVRGDWDPEHRGYGGGQPLYAMVSTHSSTIHHPLPYVAFSQIQSFTPLIHTLVRKLTPFLYKVRYLVYYRFKYSILAGVYYSKLLQ